MDDGFSNRHYKPKLPVQQLVILSVARIADPIGLTSVNPYLPEMIESFGVAKDDIARWAGLVGAVFAACQSLTAVPWGWLSDRIGRKPAILMGLGGTMVGFILWGVSSSLPMAMLVRAIHGGAGGNVGIIRTVVAELVREKELQPRAFSIMPLVWSIGSVFGPAFGGFLAQPARQWPEIFGKSHLLQQYPFLLPNLVASIVFMGSLLITTLFLRETLDRKANDKDCGLLLGEQLMTCFKSSKRHQHHKKTYSDIEASKNLLSDAEREEAIDLASLSSTKSKTRSILTSQTILILTAYTFLAFHSTAFDQALPVFLNYPRQNHTPENTELPLKFSGGYGLSSDRIGAIFTIFGVGSGLIQFLLFPPLCRRLGPSRFLNASALLFPAAYIAAPYLSLVEGDVLRYVALIAVLLVKGFANIAAFPCLTILLTNSAPSLKVLGTLNGIATMTSGIGKALGPAIIGEAFTAGVQRGYMVLPWWILAVVGVIGAIPAWFVVEGDGPSYDEPVYEIDAEPQVLCVEEQEVKEALHHKET